MSENETNTNTNEFPDRLSVKANVRRPRCAATYVEHDKTTPDQVIERLRPGACRWKPFLAV